MVPARQRRKQLDMCARLYVMVAAEDRMQDLHDELVAGTYIVEGDPLALDSLGAHATYLFIDREYLDLQPVFDG